MVSRLCISQWQQAWRIYFLLLQILLFSVILQCFIIYVFWVLYSWLLRCDCCQNWQMCFFYTNELYTTTKQSYPKMCFLLLTTLCKSCFFLFVFFNFTFISVFGKKENKKQSWIRIVVTILSCLSIFFRIWLLLKISWFLKCSSVAACAVCFSSSSLCLSNTWGWLTWRRSQIE